MSFSFIENALWILGFCTNIVLLLVLFRSGEVRLFPVFSSYIAYELLVTILLFMASQLGSSHLYFLAYWSCALADYVLQLMIVLEISRQVLLPISSWIRDAKKSVLAWSALGLLSAIALSLAITPTNQHGISIWATRSSMFTSLLVCALFLAMISAANRLGLQWRGHLMVLSQGFTFWAAIALICDIAGQSTVWRQHMFVFDEIRSAANIAATAYIAARFCTPERKPVFSSTDMQDYLRALHGGVQHDLDTLEKGRSHL